MGLLLFLFKDRLSLPLSVYIITHQPYRKKVLFHFLKKRERKKIHVLCSGNKHCLIHLPFFDPFKYGPLWAGGTFSAQHRVPLEVARKIAAVILVRTGKIEILLSHNATEAGDKRSWQTAYIKFAGIEEGKKANREKWQEGCGSNDNCLMHFHWGLSLAANAKGWGITKKVQMCYLPLRCCGLTSTILPLLVCILRLWGLYSDFNVSVNFQGLLRFVLCIQQQKKNLLITERNTLFSLTAGQKYIYIYIQWAFPIRQGSLLMSGNVLNSYPQGVSYTMTNIHERSSVTRHSQLLPVTHNSWSKLKCQKNSCQTAASLFCRSCNYDEQPRVCA